MPLSASLSLWGMYQYDDTVLDNLSLPAGMDADNVKQNLLVETAGLSILYTDPDFLKTVIGLWSAERQDVWNKLYATTVLQYDPIENYDRKEESSSRNSAGSTGSTTVTSSATAYDSDDLADTGRSTSAGNNQTSSVGNYTSRVHGNIGVTTTQQMIESERKVAEFCMTEYIINDFIQRFCLMVY